MSVQIAPFFYCWGSESRLTDTCVLVLHRPNWFAEDSRAVKICLHLWLKFYFLVFVYLPGTNFSKAINDIDRFHCSTYDPLQSAILEES